jgi:hypothetical protein
MIGTTTVTVSSLEEKVLEWTIEQVRILIGIDAPFDLVGIDRGDQLTDEQIAAYIADDYETLDDSMDDWLSDVRRDAAIEALQEELATVKRYGGDRLVEHLISTGAIHQYTEEENEAVKILMRLEWDDIDSDQELVMLIEEHDESDVIKDLAGNTNSKLFRTTLIDGESGWSQDEEGIEEIATALVELCRGTLTISTATDIARDLTQSWDTLHEGIDLDVVWYGDVETAYQGNLHGLEFNRPWLLMIDRWNGAGETIRTEQGVHLFTTPGEVTRLDAKSTGYNWQTIAGSVESTYSPEYVAPITKEEA